MKKLILKSVTILALLSIPIYGKANCTLQVNPENNGWCGAEVNEQGEIVDYFCQDEAANTDPNGNNLPLNCFMPPF
jgi:hypothetical protein